MKSAYPSSQSFFDASSDSISTTDMEKCRTNSSFSSLSDLFSRKSNGKSDLFSNVRTPVFVPAEVTFPSRKNRECEDRVTEKVSLWHEWGSGECPGEESSGLLSEVFKSSSSEMFKGTSSNLFPSVGSANASIVPEEFTFPERRKREDESWRECRGIRQEWGASVPTVDNNVRESTAMISSVVDFFANNPAKPSKSLSSSESSLFSNPGAPVGSQPEFPARRKRNENPFWKDYSFCAEATPSDCTTSGSSTHGVNSLSGLYSKSSSNNCSSLFSNLRTVNVNSEEVVFPSRKKNPDRNAWRDWSNTGYSDWAEDDLENVKSQTKSLAAQKEVQVVPAEKRPLLARPVQSAATRQYKIDSAGVEPGPLATESALRKLAHSGREIVQSVGGEASRDPSESSAGSLLAGKECGGCQALASALTSSAGNAHNAERMSARCDRIASSETEDGEVCGEMLTCKEVDEDVNDVHVEGKYRSIRRDLHEQRMPRHRAHSFPPPLGFLGGQGSLRVPHHVPWVQLQPVRSEGRFILQEVKVTQPVVFEPIREQGRLVLHLIRQDDVSEHTEREGQGCQITSGESSHTVKEVIARHADESLEVDVKVTSRAVDEHETGHREQVKEKVRKASKCPKIHPEGYLPFQNEASETIPRQAVESPKELTPMEKKPTEAQESESERTIMAAQNDLADGFSERCTALLPDPGWQDRYNFHNPAAFASEKVVDVAGNRELPALFRREIEAPSQRNPFWNSTSMKLRDSDSQAPYKSAFRSCNPRNAVPAESGQPLLPTLHRSRSIRNSTLSELGRAEGEKEETSKDRWRGREERFEPRHSFVSSGQGFDGALGLQATAHFLHWSLRKRAKAPGDPDARLGYPTVAASFLCADGVGKRHHEKSFWEQPCVS